MAKRYHTERLVEFHDTDMAGIMHFSAFFQYMEMAEHQFLRDLGFSIYTQIEGEHISFPRVKSTCEYRSPARCEDILAIDVGVDRVGEKSVTYSFQFAVDSREVAIGEITAVCCRIQHDAPPVSVPIPAILSNKLKEYT